MSEIVISHTQLFIICAYIGCVFLIQGVCILGAMYIGSRMAQGKPLVDKSESRIELNELLFPEIQEPDYPVEEPHISWKMKEPDYGDAEEK
jgi:hypothetical protein